VFFIIASYWAYIGTFALIIMSWQDIKRNMNIDDRQNWLMYGVTLSLLSHIKHKTSFILMVTLLVIGISIYLRRMKSIGDGDISALVWILTGFAYINLYYSLLFFVGFCVIWVAYALIKFYVFKFAYPTPFMSVILFSFILGCAFWGLYV